jgi:hypothetical protein
VTQPRPASLSDSETRTARVRQARRARRAESDSDPVPLSLLVGHRAATGTVTQFTETQSEALLARAWHRAVTVTVASARRSHAAGKVQVFGVRKLSTVAKLT